MLANRVFWHVHRSEQFHTIAHLYVDLFFYIIVHDPYTVSILRLCINRNEQQKSKNFSHIYFLVHKNTCERESEQRNFERTLISQRLYFMASAVVSLTSTF